MLKKLIEKKAALIDEMQKMIESAATENRAFNETEQKKFDEIETEIKALDSTIQAEERARSYGKKVQAGEPESKEEIEKRSFADYLRGKSVEMRSGEQNVTMSNNSAIIPVTIANKIIDSITEICPILSGADIYHEKGTLKIPKWTLANTNHDVTFGYASEFSELVADSGKFASVDLGGYLAGGLVLVGRSVINSATFDIASFIINKVAEKAAVFLEHELLVGTGSSAAQGATATSNSVTAAATNAITLDELITLQSSIKTAYQTNACWTMHPTTFTYLKKLKDTTNRPLLESDPSKPFPYTILGKPVYLSDNMPTIAASAKTILYGDYSGLSVNFREDIGIDILREKYATQHAIGINAWLEFDSKVSDENKLAVLVQKAS